MALCGIQVKSQSTQVKYFCPRNLAHALAPANDLTSTLGHVHDPCSAAGFVFDLSVGPVRVRRP